MNTNSCIVRIFRKSNSKFHSFERVFSQICLRGKSNVFFKDVFLPSENIQFFSLIRNCLTVLNYRNNIIHITGGVHYLILILDSNKTILTIHDTVFLKSSTGLKGWILKKLFLDWPVKKATIISTISEKSKQEIIDNTACNPDKIHVIPNPVDQHIYYKQKVFNVSCPNLLFIGSTQFKNLERAVLALQGIPCTLTLIGKYNESQLRLIEQSTVSVIIKSNLSDDQMAEEYVAADIVYFPSLYEGFGLPIIEGQKAGRVVLTSNISPMKDVAGAGACLVNPESIDSIANGIKRIIADVNYRNKLIQEGFVNIEKYDPNEITKQYESLYVKLFGKD